MLYNKKPTRKDLYAYGVIVLLFFSFCSLPNTWVDSLRGHCISMLCKLPVMSSQVMQDQSEEITRLALENAVLRDRVFQQLPTPSAAQDESLLGKYLQTAQVGHIIYRDPSHWGSSCWINLGKHHGIRRNAPVLSHIYLVGIVDYVGHYQSRVRLITDAAVHPSVMAVRGNEQIYHVQHTVQQLYYKLSRIVDDSIHPDLRLTWMTTLASWLEMLPQDQSSFVVARGTICGSGSPLWRKHGSMLRGEGFCHADSNEGRIQLGDILVTTGLDGVFPPGLHVAQVTRVHAEKEGACSFNLEAIPLVEDLGSMTSVLVLSPVEFNPQDVPDIFQVLWDS